MKASDIITRLGAIMTEALGRQATRIKSLEARIAAMEAAAGIEHKASARPLKEGPAQVGEVVSVGSLRFKYMGEGRWRAVA